MIMVSHAHKQFPGVGTQSRAAAMRSMAGVRSGGFTLIEAVVVIIVLGVLAGLVVPRMLSTGPRQAKNEARAVQRLLTCAAEKTALLGEPVAVEYSGTPEATLTLYTQRVRTLASGQVGVPEWRADTLVDPVTLTALQLKSARADGVALASARWRVVFRPGQTRPDLAITLAPKGDAEQESVSIVLDAHAPSARSSDGTSASKAPAVARTRDLDDLGQGTKTW